MRHATYLPLLLALLGAAPAHADVVKATANFEKGTRLYQVGEYAKALEEFKAGYVEEADPSFLFNAAQCYWRLGQDKEAVLGYRRFLSLAPETPLRADVERKIGELEEKLRQAEAVKAPPVVPKPRASAPRRPGNSNLTESAPEARSSSSTWPIWLGAVLTVGFAGGATAVGLTTNTRYDELRNSCGKSPTGCSDRSISDIRNRGRLVNLLGALAGVSAVATGIGFFARDDEASVAVAFRF